MQDDFVLAVMTDQSRYWLIDGDDLRRLAAAAHDQRLDLLDELDLSPAKIGSDSEVDLYLVLDDFGSWTDLDEDEFQNSAKALLDYYDNL